MTERRMTMNQMKKNNIGLVEYCRAQLGRPYWYGCFGQISTEKLLDCKMRQYPSYYTARDYMNQFGVKVHDCIGLVKGYIWGDGPEDPSPKYANGFKDLSANMTLRHCEKKGSIATIPEIPGVLVFMSGHVGVYIGNGEVIEARGHRYGVVLTKLKNRKWTNWGMLPEIQYIS